MFKFKLMFIASFLFSFSALISQNLAEQDNAILQAMRDEISRSMNELKLESLKSPYYIEYKVTETDASVIKSTLGTLISSDDFKTSSLTVDVRVGDYEFDNSNFFDVGLSFFGSSDDEERFKRRNLGKELTYKGLRRELWLATDGAYKQAAELFSKKEAARRNRTRIDTTHDFLKIEPQKVYNKSEYPKFDSEKYIEQAKQISAVFREYPEIFSSTVGFEFLPKNYYYVNSEGMEYIKTELYFGVEIVAFLQNDDGMPLTQHYSNYVNLPSQMPSLDSLVNAARYVANGLMAQVKAGELQETYSGPVMFVGQAAAQSFAQSFVNNFVAQRPQMTEGGVQESDRDMAFQNKVGGRVLPEFLSVSAMPRQPEFNQVPLVGSFETDEFGLQSQDVNLVQKGYLKSLLSSRVPTRRVRTSNGHSRGGAAMISNIIISVDDIEKVKSYDELKAELISHCKERELPYGILVKGVMDKNIMFTTLYSVARGIFSPPRTPGKLVLTEAYKVNLDGSEERIRGVEVNGLLPQSFKDILFVGKRPYVMNYLAPSVVSPFITGGDQYVASSIVTPDLLFEDLEIKITESDFKKPPFISNPVAGK